MKLSRFSMIAVAALAAFCVVSLASHVPALAAAFPFAGDIVGYVQAHAGALSAFTFIGATATANTPRPYELGDFSHLPMADNVKIYEGSAVGDNGSGYARALVAGDPFRGFCVEFADNTVTGHVVGGVFVQMKRWGMIQLSITGVTAVTDVGKPVYASDDNTFTLTAGSNSYIGRIVRWISGTQATVEFDGGRGGFSKETTVTDSSAGTSAPTTGVSANAQKETVVLPIGSLAGLINAQTRKIALPFAGTVTAMSFRVGNPATTAAKAATLTAQINGTPVTGGIASLTSANCTPAGAAVAATAITALNTFTAGQTIEVAVSAVTAFVEGDGYVEFTIINTDKANQAATLTAAINAFNTQVSA